jgi:hypothetical protein
MDYSNGETTMKNTTITVNANANTVISNWEAMIAFRKMLKEEAPEKFQVLMEDRRGNDLPPPVARGYWQ